MYILCVPMYKHGLKEQLQLQKTHKQLPFIGISEYAGFKCLFSYASTDQPNCSLPLEET